MIKVRKKTWDEKVSIVSNSFQRCMNDIRFGSQFYSNLFFLNPHIREYFKDTDFEHQNKALVNGLKFLIGFLDNSDENSRVQIIRLAKTHSKFNLDVHPHHYYYWIEALIMTAKTCDRDWYDELEYYWREVVNFPVTFMISQYYRKD